MATSALPTVTRASEIGARRFLSENALSLVLAVAFFALWAAQTATGLHVYNDELREAGRAGVSLGAYLRTGHFLEATFENWESEFLQMGVFVLLAVKLRQNGSTESKGLEGRDETDEDPRRHRHDPKAPGPVRRGGVALWLYERSLASSFFAAFLASFFLHGVGGWMLQNEERAAKGLGAIGYGAFMTSSELWFESFQNWQSEFLAVLALVVGSIYRGSAARPSRSRSPLRTSRPAEAPACPTWGRLGAGAEASFRSVIAGNVAFRCGARGWRGT
jgi:hypothetical protein